MAYLENRKYLNPTILDLSTDSFNMYKLYAWAIIKLHREFYSNDWAMLANRGVLHDMEYPKVYAILKYFKKLYREQKKSSPKHKKGELRVVEAGKQKLKKDRSLIKSARQRLDDILDNRRGRQEVA
jgi:hypothetical protein